MELKEALFSMEHDKSPGLDGLTPRFYIAFWWEFVDIFTKLLIEIYHRNELTDSMKRGVLTLIPKKGDLRRLTNWRPITLLNTDYKIISKALAKRISKVIHLLVSDDQTCCIPGRDIVENVLTMQNIINYVNSDGIMKGFALKIDQFKAFDRVNHNYLINVLKRMGFGMNLQKWIQILYNDIHGCIKHNGYISTTFPIQRGVRQGCPISAILYVLTAEPLHEAIVKSPHISGIQFCDTEARIFQHADDTTFFVSSITSIHSVLSVIKLYEHASGSLCNLNKTELLVFGKNRIDPGNFNFPVRNDYIEVLGVAIGNELKNMEKTNWEDKVKSCCAVLKMWKGRALSFKGKAIIINALVVSRLIYMATIMPVPGWVATTLRESIGNFIWRGKNPAISYKSLGLPLSKGGLNICDIERKRDALRIKFISKIISNNVNEKLKKLMLYFLNHYENMQLGESIFLITPRRTSMCNLNPYYREMLLAWARLTNGLFQGPFSRDEMLFQPIFHNPLIADVNEISLHNRQFIDGGIIRVSDLMYEILPSRLPANAVHECITIARPDSLISIDDVSRVLDSVLGCIPESWINEIYSSDKIVSTQNEIDLNFSFYHKGDIMNGSRITCKLAYELLQSEPENVPKGELHWKNVYAGLEFGKLWSNVYKNPKRFHDADIDFKVLHNILYTNEKLHKFKIVPSPLCTFCGTGNETIPHLFVHCPETILLWNYIVTKLNQITENIAYDTWERITLFGSGSNVPRNVGKLVDFVFNIYKCVIWNSRVSQCINNYKTNISIYFHNTLRNRINTIYETHKKNNRLDLFYKLFAQGNILISAIDTCNYLYHFDRG